MVEGIIYRYRCGIAWRDLPDVYGPWQTVWRWHRRMAGDGVWDRVQARLHEHAQQRGLVHCESAWVSFLSVSLSGGRREA